MNQPGVATARFEETRGTVRIEASDRRLHIAGTVPLSATLRDGLI